MKTTITKCAKFLNVHEKINIRSYYSAIEKRNKIPYQMTFGFLDIWNWNLKPFNKPQGKH